jgi:ABC-2 type transport system ATP-binding protein
LSSEHAVEAVELTKRFGAFTAVDRISFDVERGEIFGFLGPNGAGKTTTIRMLLSLLSPSAGSAQVLGYDIQREAGAIRRRIGYMSQRFSLYSDLSVEQNLEFFGGTYGLHGARLRQRKIYALDMAGLRGHEHAKASTLPGGWRQSLALGCAILHEPELLFLDEPTAGVDPISRRRFWDLLYELSDRGQTLFVTTHYMDEAERCHRLAFIQRGRIVALDTPEEIKRGTMPAGVLEIECEDTQHALAALKTREGLHASLYGTLIHVTADRLESREAEIRAILVQARVSIVSMQRVPASLEDAFIVSVREQEQDQGLEQA